MLLFVFLFIFQDFESVAPNQVGLKLYYHNLERNGGR